MGKGKLAKFADMATYNNVFQYPYGALKDIAFPLTGRWREDYFHNDNPIILELGCGKGEYTVGLAKMFPDVNFIGVDIKGARMWTGATQAQNEGLKNVAFLRTNIEIIDRFFAEGEVQEIWLTFCDPQMKNPRKRLTSTWFLERYRKFLSDGGFVHLKTDSNFLFTYTSLLVEKNHLPVLVKQGFGCRQHPDVLRRDVDSPRIEYQIHEILPASRWRTDGARRGNRVGRLPLVPPRQAQQ